MGIELNIEEYSCPQERFLRKVTLNLSLAKLLCFSNPDEILDNTHYQDGIREYNCLGCHYEDRCLTAINTKQETHFDPQSPHFSVLREITAGRKLQLEDAKRIYQILWSD